MSDDGPQFTKSDWIYSQPALPCQQSKGSEHSKHMPDKENSNQIMYIHYTRYIVYTYMCSGSEHTLRLWYTAAFKYTLKSQV